MTTHTCTHGPAATTRKRCGKPAVTSFVGSDGETYHECAEHAINFTASNYRVGDPVVVKRYGKTYAGTVDHITSRGHVMVAFRTDNGRKKIVRHENA